MESIEVGTESNALSSESNDGDSELNALASELNVTVYNVKYSQKKTNTKCKQALIQSEPDTDEHN